MFWNDTWPRMCHRQSFLIDDCTTNKLEIDQKWVFSIFFASLTLKWPWCDLDMTLLLCTSKAQLLLMLLFAHKLRSYWFFRQIWHYKMFFFFKPPLPINSAVGMQVCPMCSALKRLSHNIVSPVSVSVYYVAVRTIVLWRHIVDFSGVSPNGNCAYVRWGSFMSNSSSVRRAIWFTWYSESHNTTSLHACPSVYNIWCAPGGHPSNYGPGPALLNFSDRANTDELTPYSVYCCCLFSKVWNTIQF